MSFYPPKISEKLKAARDAGELPDASAVGTGASFGCGTFVRFFLRIEGDGKKIVEARYKTSACGFLIAAAEVLCGEITGEKLAALHGFDKKILRTRIENELGEFPAHRTHCLDVCLDALQKTFADFRASQIDEFAGETALICTCFGVAEDTIENLIETESLETVAEVTARCGAGGGCGACQPLIQEILDGREFFG